MTWTNLGLLYLYHNDIELANETLYRAQALDPDYTLAWVGQGLVASANGHHQDAKALFEHAVGLISDLVRIFFFTHLHIADCRVSLRLIWNMRRGYLRGLQTTILFTQSFVMCYYQPSSSYID